MAKCQDSKETIISQHIGKKIRRRRIELEMTQTDLGNHLPTSFQQIQKYEKGTNGTSSYRILQIAEALNISVSDLFIKAYHDHEEIIGYLKPFETIAEINIKDEKPLILKEEWIVNEKEEQN